MDHNTIITRIDRESRGQGDRYEELQPTSTPKNDPSFIGTRLDFSVEFELDICGKELRWCQGNVNDISDGSSMLYPNTRSRCYKDGEIIRILWDTINGSSDQYEST